ncbi:uncharacterized protein LOC135489423 [Lineus longissimus]|uniref:uncharacterized protein LOC135489423 n=1 Tax=Lineus longissimus TaxID=88925 RepID=UPI00315D9F23
MLLWILLLLASSHHGQTADVKGNCTNIESAWNCALWTWEEQCVKNRDWMSWSCAQDCNTCPVPDANGCENKLKPDMQCYSLASQWGDLCKTRASMNVDCAKACKQCEEAECSPEVYNPGNWDISPSENGTLPTWRKTRSDILTTSQPLWDTENHQKGCYLLATTGHAGGYAKMSKQVTATIGQDFCVQFYYWMYGPGPDFPSNLHLNVSVSIGNVTNIIWADNQNRGRSWTFVQVALKAKYESFVVAIGGSRDINLFGDVAVDKVKLIEGVCPERKEGTRKASFGESVYIEHDHTTYGLYLNLTASHGQCQEFCQRRQMNISPLGSAKALWESQQEYADNCFDLTRWECDRNAPNGGCENLQQKDRPLGWILRNCSLSCNVCDNKRGNCYDFSSRCLEKSRYGQCESAPLDGLKHCSRTCGTCRHKGPASRIFTVSMWVGKDSVEPNITLDNLQDLNASWTGLCPAWNVSILKFVRVPCNVVLPCLCEDYKVPVYTNILSTKPVIGPNVGNITNLPKNAHGCREMGKSGNFTLELGTKHRVSSVLLTMNSGTSPPLGYHRPPDKIPESPIARRPYFNLAAGRPSVVSSIVDDNWGGAASSANDGKRNNNHAENWLVCTWTAVGSAGAYHWWYVDLQGIYNVHGVTVVRRGNCCGPLDDNFIDFKIFVTHSVPKDQPAMDDYWQNNTKAMCYKGDRLDVGNPIATYECRNGSVGRYVILMKSMLGVRQIALNLCELEVFGEPVNLKEDSVPKLPYCADVDARAIGGYCYRFIGEPAPSDQQEITCRRWNPPTSESVPLEDLSAAERDAVRNWLYIEYSAEKVWGKRIGTECSVFIVGVKEKYSSLGRTKLCFEKLPSVCRSRASDVYPFPMINLPEPPVAPVNVGAVNDMAVFALPELMVDSYLIQWEIFIQKRPQWSMYLYILEKNADGSLKETKKQRMSFWQRGINFGGYMLNREGMITLKKGNLIGLRTNTENISDILQLSEQKSSNQLTADLYEYALGDFKPVTSNMSLVLPFRIWTLPKTVALNWFSPQSWLKLCNPYEKYLIFPLNQTEKSAVHVSAGGAPCHRVTSFMDGYSASLFQCDKLTTSVAISRSDHVNICDVKVFAAKVSESPSTTPIPASSTRVRGLPWKQNGPCVAIGAARESVQWLQIDLLVTYDSVTAKIIVTKEKDRPRNPKFQLIVTAENTWSNADPLYVGKIDNLNRTETKQNTFVTFPCTVCYSGRFVTLLEVGDALGMEICDVEVFGDREGDARLGIASGYILDEQFTASSSLNGYEPHKARLDSSGAWCTDFDVIEKHYLQVDLRSEYHITGLETQGRKKDGVTGFRLKYGTDQNALRWYLDETKQPMVFFTERLGQTSNIFQLVTQIRCRFLQIHVESFNQAACLRFELLGYQKQGYADPEFKITQPTTIYSPNKPNYYGTDRTISWTITPPTGQFVRIYNVTLNSTLKNRLEEMNIGDWRQASDTLCQDVYTLYKNGQPIVSDFGYYIHDDSGPVTLKLFACQQSAYHPLGWFQAHVDFVDCPGFGFNKKNCKGAVSVDLNATQQACGYIGSPLFPNVYPIAGTCAWDVAGRWTSFIQLEFLNLDVAGDGAACTGDQVAVLLSGLGDNANSPRKIVCNGDKTFTTMNSNWNKISVRYQRVRPEAGAGKGFIIKLTEVNIDQKLFNETYGVCPKGWLQHLGACYFFSKADRLITWTEADGKCKDMYAHLASVQDHDQHDFITYNLLTNWEWDWQNPGVYIGLTDQERDGRYTWTDGSPVSFTNWRPGQPDGSTLEGCSIIEINSLSSGRYWQDIPCAIRKTKQFICKKSAVGVKVKEAISSKDIIKSWNGKCNPKRQFTCSNGDCIQNLFVCDGNKNCRNGRDEMNCNQTHYQGSCGFNQFRCESGSCISASGYCNFKDDCNDKTDESRCVWPECKTHEFLCMNKQCLSNTSMVKNFVKDCVDGSDETVRGCNGFECFNGKCIPHELHCDGVKDCPGTYSEDETDCTNIGNKPVGEGYLNCSTNFMPYPATQHCIYDNDFLGYTTGCRDFSHLKKCESFKCPPYYLKCPGSYCIPLRMICDGTRDCASGEDELNCESFACPGMFQCKDRKNCIIQEKVCDGIEHCRDGDDELSCSFCPDSCTCIGDAYQCSEKSLQSIPNLPGDARAVDLTNNSLGDNSLREMVYPFLGKLTLSKNDITSLEGGVFRNLVNLYHLDLRSNKLVNLSSNAFMGLQNLRELLLTENNLTTISPSAFVVKNVSGIARDLGVKVMNLSGTSLRELNEGSFGGLGNVTSLDLSNNHLNMIPLGTFRYTSKVQHLNLTGNTLGDFTGKEDFKDLPELKELRSNHFRFCCMAPQVPEENCFPKMDPFSSCTDLIRIGALRIFLWILGTIAVGGNILVLLLRILTKEPTTANTTIITSLAVSDLLMGVYLYIIAAADTTFRGYYIEVDWSWRKGIGCKIAGFLSVLSSEVSVFTLTIMSVDRFLVVVFPFSKQKINFKKAKILVASIWIFGVILAGAPFCVDYLRHSYYSRSGVCLSLHLTSEPAPGWEYSVAIFLGLNLVAFMIIAVLYTWMYVIIKRSVDMMKHKTSRKKGENKELVVARKMALIILTDFACWMPIIILGLAAISGKVTIPGDVYAWIAVFVLPINSAMNPILYTLSSLDLIKLICGKKEPQLDYSGSTRTNVSTPPLMHSSALCIAGYNIRAARTASRVLSVVSLQQP